MADELSKQTGLHIGCCQALVAGVPWGMAKFSFEADNKPAREVLKRLILAEQQANSQASNWHPNYEDWVVRCDGTGAPWCFIEVEARNSSPASSFRSPGAAFRLSAPPSRLPHQPSIPTAPWTANRKTTPSKPSSTSRATSATNTKAPEERNDLLEHKARESSKPTTEAR